MAYRIRYKGKNPAPQPKSRLPGLTVLFFVLFLIAVFRFCPEGRSLIQTLVIPGGEQSIQALEAMAQNLRDGMGLQEAAECFRRELTEDGQVR